MKIIFYILIPLISLVACKTNDRKDISFEGVKNFDLNKVLKEANLKEKSVLLYFSSVACVNCRKIENKILNNSTIKKIIFDKYILITLVVDDREIADKNYWKNSKMFNRILKKTGEINCAWQTELTRTGTQPYFAVISQEKTISSKIGYTGNNNDLLNFLNK